MMPDKINRIAASVLLLCASPIMAAPIPDSGQTIRELQQQPELSLPKTIPPLQPASAPVAAPVLAPSAASAPVAAPVLAPAAASAPVAAPVLEPSSAPVPESIPKPESGKTLQETKLASIDYTNFVPGTIRLKPEADVELDAIVEFAVKNPNAVLELVGYSDSKTNHVMSLGLADSVRNYLVTKGVAGKRISIREGSVAYPVADNQNSKSKARNRRVDVFSVMMEDIKEDAAVSAPVTAPTLATVPGSAAVTLGAESVTVPTPPSKTVPEEAAVPKIKPKIIESIKVNAIRVSGNSIFPTAELEALLANLVGGEHTLADLNEGAARITAYYHQHGYIVSRAYIPPQEIKDGVIVIEVQEGHIGEQKINNQSRLSDLRANNYFGTINNGDVLQAAPVERALLLLNETPGVGSARASLKPGASVGATDLVVELTPSAPYAGNIQADNYGNYYTGEYRLGAELGFNSPLRIGDLVTLRAVTSNQNLTYGYAAYQIPVGGKGFRLGGTYSDTSYHLGKDFTVLQAHGTASIASLFAVYPFIRSRPTNLSATITLENKHLTDDSILSSSDKTVRVGTLALVGNHQDTFGGLGVTMYNLSIATGRLSMDPISLFQDQGYGLFPGVNANGVFARLDYTLNRLQRLSDRNALSLALSGQFASKNLNSSEQFSLGGVYGVRAYPQGEGAGDVGCLVNIELRHAFSERFQGLAFYDAGKISVYRIPNPYIVESNTRFISGAGVGVHAKIAGVQITADLAVRGSGGQPTSEPTTMNRKVRLWAELTKQF